MTNSPQKDHRTLLQNALVALEKMQTRLNTTEQALHEPLAIIGMGFRFPGGAKDAASFWQLLYNGVDAITEVPPDRWDVDAFYDPDPDKQGKSYTRWGGFVDEVDQFDPDFFGISPREAQSLDPQQRLLLETTWEALENAGRASPKLAGSQTGVFVGMVASDYGNLPLINGHAYDIDAYFGTGISRSVAAGRIAYTFNLHGPAVAIDTACSSSLMAVHQACQSLRVKECDMAVAGGVNLMLEPLANISTSRARMMSFDGRCKTFDAAADGYVRSDGCAMIVLKRLADAIGDGDNILSVILGTAANQDGRSNGLTAPNGKAQEAVIRAALADASIDPGDVSYVEAHGTGTSLGDPIEVRALSSVYGAEHSPDEPLMIGSVKTNVGHLEAAAGIVGLVKVVLALQHKTIPPHLHLQEPNPYIPWDQIPVTVPTEPTVWPTAEGKRRIAGLSSFGFSGTNVHTIIGEPPAPATTAPAVERPVHLLALSARSNASLAQLAQQYASHLQANPSLSLADVAFTANTGRSHFSERLALLAQSTAEAQAKLAAWWTGERPAGFTTGAVVTTATPEVVFLFTGQGSQYVGMGRLLYATQPTFRRVLDRCDELLRPYLDVPLLSVIFGEEYDANLQSLIHETAYTQPALFAIEYALAQLWRSWGVEPAAVIGHSVGEYVAACLAGVFSLEDGLKLVAARGRLMQALPAGGAMAAVFADEAHVRAAIAPYAGEVAVAAINGPDNVVISGVSATIQTILDSLADAGTKARRLTVSHAFHSPLMDPMLDEFEQVASTITYHSPQLGLVANVTGQLVTDNVIDAGYWRQHVRQPVRFADAIHLLHAEGYRFFLEVGPSPTLLSLGQRCWPASETGLWLPSLRPGKDDWQQMLQSLSLLYVNGLDVAWEGFERDYPGRRRLPLPTYPFQRERYWMEAADSRSNGRGSLVGQAVAHQTVDHPLLDQRLTAALPIFQAQLSVSRHPYLAEHRIHGVLLLPAAAYVEMVTAAAGMALAEGPYALADMVIHEALPLPSSGARTVQLVLTPEELGARFQLFSQESEPGAQTTDAEAASTWRLHASGKVVRQAEDMPAASPVSLKQTQSRLAEEMPVATYYAHLAQVGANYGPAFQSIQQIWRRDGEALGRVVLPAPLTDEAGAYQVHPALLDGCFQLLGAAVPGADLENEAGDVVYVPVGLEQARLYGNVGAQVWARVEIRAAEGDGQETLVGDLTLFAEEDEVVATVTGLRLQRASRQALQRAIQTQFNDWQYEVAWPRQPRHVPTVTRQAPGHWLIFADDQDVATDLAERLEAQGETCVLVYPGDALVRREPHQWQINPLQPEDFSQLLAMLEAERPLHGVVHLWSLADTLTEVARPEVLQDIQARNCGSVLHLVQALSERGSTPRLWLVTRGVQPIGHSHVNAIQAPLWGLGNVLALEHEALRSVRVDLDPAETGGLSLFQELWLPDGEDQIALRGTMRHVARLVRRPATVAPKQLRRPLQLEIAGRGVLDNLQLQPMTRRAPGPGEVEIEVYATGLNFRDVLNALGMYPGDPGPLGSECAGRVVAVGEGVETVQAGDEVIALALRSFSSYVTVPAVLVTPKPSNLAFVEAATIPITFLTAHYALNHLAQMKAGDRVLIHAATGGVGMAAVQLAQRVGAEIFGTAGSPEKRERLRSLGVQHVMDSRSLDFADRIMDITDGAGVDIVLNSLAGDFIPKSLSVLAENGRFVELGKTGVWDEPQVRQLKPGIAYFVLYLGEITESNPELIREMMLNLLTDFQAGTLKPLPQQVFPLANAVKAFRFMAQAQHVGKIVLTQEPPATVASDSIAHGNATYLISGGLGGLGLVFARWLADQGARYLVLVGRNRPSAAAQAMLRELEERGVRVEVAQADISRQEQVNHVLARIAEAMPPLRGIIHAAGVLSDGLLLQQTWPDFARVMAPKIEGAWNLHVLTEELPLDFFILFSAGAALLGSPGQSNYAAANAFLDALAHRRRAQGLPALSVNWGAWADVGMAATLGEVALARWQAQGLDLITPEQGVQILQTLLEQQTVQAAVLPINWTTFGQHFARDEERPFLSGLIRPAQPQVSSKTATVVSEVKAQLAHLPASERRQRLHQHVRQQVMRVLGRTESQEVNVNQPLIDLGLDSLMAVELRNALSTSVGQTLPASLTFDYPSITVLADHLGQLLWQTEMPATERKARVAQPSVDHPLVGNEPIAIVGIGCRIPGGPDDPASFWEFLAKGVDAVTEVPADRWDIDAYYDPDPDAPGKMYTRYGAFLKDIDQFDPQFFSISPREAVAMDPQQRLLLEVSWEALEHAGQSPAELAGSQTGVFLGISSSDYLHLFTKRNDPTLMTTYVSTGNAHSVASGRIAYLLGLQGPNLAVDTACSSSLVATHLACQSLRAGECDLALAGGVNLILNPETNVVFSRARMMSKDGRCKTFDAGADGYVRGEGAAMIVLKRLSQAQADGDNILAVIRGSAVNQDGRSNGLTAPSGLAQEAVIRTALTSAGVAPADVSYIEAHGTGTPLGDPIEIRALGAVYGAERDDDSRLIVGSVKTNLGHLETAAGVVSLIKLALALQHREIPRHLHLEEPSPFIPWEELPVTVPTRHLPWPADRPLIGGVSSFGFSGTNAHVILEAAPTAVAKAAPVERPAHILALSATGENALQALARRYEQHLANGEVDAADVCYTANSGRSHFSHRLALIGSDGNELREKLAAFRAGEDPAGAFRHNSSGTEQRPRIAFLFTGQGAQYPGMGRALYDSQPTFRAALNQCAELLRPYLDVPLISVLFGDERQVTGNRQIDDETSANVSSDNLQSPIADGTSDNLQSLVNETAYTQPALFALEYALARLWQSWGVQPDAVMGHSVGEYVAACIAGVFTLEDGVRLIAERGRLMQALPQNGAMAAIFAGEAQVREAIAPYAADVSIAAVNGPDNVVISGLATAVQTILDQLQANGVKARRLTVSHAFHSPLMAPMLDDFERVAAAVNYQPPQIPLLSNLTGTWVQSDEVGRAEYWRSHVREAVRFADGMQTLHEQGYELFLEVGPAPTLLGMGQRCLPAGSGVWLPSLRRNGADWAQMLASLAQLYVHGVAVDWRAFDREYTRRKLALPTYPFQRQRYWMEEAKSQPWPGRVFPTAGDNQHPLLGQRLRSPLIKDSVFESQLSPAWLPFLADHRVYDTVVFPATAYLEMGLAAATAAFGSGVHTVEALNIREALILPPDELRTVQLTLNDGGAFQIFSLADESQSEWKLHASGTLHRGNGDGDTPAPLSLAEVQARCDEALAVTDYYQQLAELGIQYGPAFQGIESLWRGEGEAVAQLRLPASAAGSPGQYHLHPALMDAALQVLGAAVSAEQATATNVYLPVALEHFAVYAPYQETLWAHVVVTADEPDSEVVTGTLHLYSEAGQPVAEIGGLRLKQASREALWRLGQQEYDQWLYRLAWRPQSIAPEPEWAPERPGSWLIFADSDGVGLEMAEALRQRGEQALIVAPGETCSLLDDGRWTVNPACPEDFQRLLQQALTAEHPPPTGIVYLWALNANVDEQGAADSLMANQVPATGSVLHLIQALAQMERPQTPRLWLVTRGAQVVEEAVALPQVLPEGVAQTPLWGLGRVIALEHPGLRCVCVDLDPVAADDAALLLAELQQSGVEDQVAWRDAMRYVARLVAHAPDTAPVPADQPVQLAITTKGILDNLTLQPLTRRQPGPDEVEVRVRASGLNFRDVLNALGMYPGNAGPLGSEFAGEVVAVGADVTEFEVGDAVLGLSGNSFSSFVTTDVMNLVRKPANLSFAEAATIPITFLTAYYGLHHLAKIRRGDRVLIHAAAGGVGMAAVQLAKQAGAEVFGTAGSQTKRDFIKSLGVDHVLHSRTLEFADDIMALTDGEGVNIVLNSLADEFIPKSLSVLADDGRFLEIGKRGIWTEEQVQGFNPTLSYFVYDLALVMHEDPVLGKAMLTAVMAAIEQGQLQPLPRQEFPLAQAAAAFRYMAQAKHMGKVVIVQEDESMSPVSESGTYLITGGLGALGLRVAQEMVAWGARHLVLTGRRAPNEAAQAALAELAAAGARVLVGQANVANREQMADLLAEAAQSMPPLRGVIHAAGVLDDGMLNNQDWSRFAGVLAPKMQGSWNLYELTRDLPLDFFVLFSSAASLLGSPGQGNYAAANAFMDGLAQQLQRTGFPALSINWGPWAEIGMAASLNGRGHSGRADQGISAITPEQGVWILHQLLQQKGSSQVAVLPADWPRLFQQFAADEEPALFAELVATIGRVVAAELPSAQQSELLAALAAAVDSDEKRTLLVEHVQEQVRRVLALSSTQPVELHKGLTDMGMDSLMAVELSNRLQKSLGHTLPSTLAFEYPTVVELVDYLAIEVLDQDSTAVEVPIEKDEEIQAALLAEVEELSEDETVESLLKELQEAGY